MLIFIIIVIAFVSAATPFRHEIMQDYNKEKNMESTEQEVNMQESLFTVEGTITKLTFVDTSKTIRVKNLKMHLYLTPLCAPRETMEFFKRPVQESDKQLRVGQHVSITARKNTISGSLNIVHIEPLSE